MTAPLTPATENALRQAYRLIKAGDKDAARAVLKPVLLAERDNIDAWWLAAHAAASPDDIRLALVQVRRLDPAHAPAGHMLDFLNRAYPIDARHATQELAPLPPPGARANPAATRSGGLRWLWNVVLVIGMLAFSFGGLALVTTLTGVTWFDDAVERAGDAIGVDVRPGAAGQLGTVSGGAPDAPQPIPVTQRKAVTWDAILLGSLREDEAHVWSFNAEHGDEIAVMLQFTAAGDATRVLELRDDSGAKLADGVGSAESGTITLVQTLSRTGSYDLVIIGRPGGPRGEYALGVSRLQ